MERRSFINRLSMFFAAVVASPANSISSTSKQKDQMKENNQNPILSVKPLGFTWETSDPFLFCVHHEDKYPKGNEKMGPDAAHFSGRHLGDDFIIKDGFRMYHGKTVPGFPGHPHRGFETITIVRQGIVDHSDSLGASGRYGNGDVQWMTAGKGVQHAEMFPLVYEEKENPMELFQIWLNLPKKSKMVEPHFKMLWKESIPRVEQIDTNNKKTTVEVIAGTLTSTKAPLPPPDSWAAESANDVSIFNIKMDAGTTWKLPATSEGINRTLYFYEGESLKIAGQEMTRYSAVEVLPTQEIVLETQADEVSVLVLQGRPIGEPVIQYGPFVMNTKEEINQSFEDFHKTQFGGWPWPKYDQVHARDLKRFAIHADGRQEKKDSL